MPRARMGDSEGGSFSNIGSGQRPTFRKARSLAELASEYPVQPSVSLHRLIDQHLADGGYGWELKLTYTEQERLKKICRDEGADRTIHILQSLPLQEHQAQIRDLYIEYIQKHIALHRVESAPIARTPVSHIESSTPEHRLAQQLLGPYLRDPTLLENGMLSSRAILDLVETVNHLEIMEALPQAIAFLEQPEARTQQGAEAADALHEYLSDYHELFGKSLRSLAMAERDLLAPRTPDADEDDGAGSEIRLAG